MYSILEVVYLHWLLFCPKLRSWKVRTHLKWEFIDVEMSRDSTVTENPKFNVDNNIKKTFFMYNMYPKHIDLNNWKQNLEYP